MPTKGPVHGGQARFHGIYADPGFFQRASREREIDALVAEAAALGPRIDELVKEWEEVELELSTLAPT
jgi:hypothetical protein